MFNLEALSVFLGFITCYLPLVAFGLQVHINYRNKSTDGYSTDFAYAQVCGFYLLVMNQTAGLVDPFSDAGRVHI